LRIQEYYKPLVFEDVPVPDRACPSSTIAALLTTQVKYQGKTRIPTYADSSKVV